MFIGNINYSYIAVNVHCGLMKPGMIFKFVSKLMYKIMSYDGLYVCNICFTLPHTKLIIFMFEHSSRPPALFV